MGMLRRHLHLLAVEQVNYPTKGEVLTFGQQKVYVSLEDARRILAQHSIHLYDLPAGFDTKSRIPGDDPSHTNALAVFKMLGAENVYVADVSHYENADFLLDLNEPVGAEYERRFDVIFDSGTMEHVFDVATCLENMTRMLKPGGCVVLAYPASNFIDHGFYSFSPTLVFDFFMANGFRDLRCYLAETSYCNMPMKSKVYEYTGVGHPFPLHSPCSVEMFFWARLCKKTKFTKPNQSLYVNLWKGTENLIVVKHPVLSRLKRFVGNAAKLIPASIRPEIIDSVLFGTRFRKPYNLRYIGKY